MSDRCSSWSNADPVDLEADDRDHDDREAEQEHHERSVGMSLPRSLPGVGLSLAPSGSRAVLPETLRVSLSLGLRHAGLDEKSFEGRPVTHDGVLTRTALHLDRCPAFPPELNGEFAGRGAD